jgi:hypothetical protein
LKNYWLNRDALLKRVQTIKINLLKRSLTLVLLSNSKANPNNSKPNLSSNSNRANLKEANNSNNRTSLANNNSIKMDKARTSAERTRTREATNTEQ